MGQITFECENCRTFQTIDFDIEDGYVTCVNCQHTVDAGVYLGSDWRDQYTQFTGKRDVTQATHEGCEDPVMCRMATWLAQAAGSEG